MSTKYSERHREICRDLGWSENRDGTYTDPEGKAQNFLPDYFGNPFWMDHMMQRALANGVRLVLAPCPEGFVCAAFEPATRRRLAAQTCESMTEALAGACLDALRRAT